MLDAQDLNQFDGNLNDAANTLLNANLAANLGGGSGGNMGGGGGGNNNNSGGGGNNNNSGGGNGGGSSGGGGRGNFKNRNFGGNNQVSDTFFLLPVLSISLDSMILKFSFSARIKQKLKYILL